MDIEKKETAEEKSGDFGPKKANGMNERSQGERSMGFRRGGLHSEVDGQSLVTFEAVIREIKSITTLINLETT